MNYLLKVILFLFFSFGFFSCVAEIEDGPGAKSPKIAVDLEQIQGKGKLVALTGYNAYSYFIYKGQPMGYEYELLKRLAADLKLELEIKVVREIDEMIDLLNNGTGDLIAFNLTVTKNRTKAVTFTEHHTLTPQVLVQRKPENWREMKLHEIENSLIRSPIDLIGIPITVRRNSSYITRLKNLSDEIGEDLNIISSKPNINIEDLISMVATGEIDYTVADKNIAELYSGYYPILDIDYAISLPQRIAWAVRKNSPKFLEAVNEWLQKEKKKNDYYTIYDRYFENSKGFNKRINSEYFSLTGGKISKYDEEIKKYALKLNLDWRLLASIIYQESKFKPDKISWTGASGLMQLMPATAKRFGVEDSSNVHENLEAGVKYLSWLEQYWSEEIPNAIERFKFVLASYNIGPGHIVDAKKLAKKYGADPNVWFDNVEQYLLKKSEAKYYNDEVVELGYARGKETVKYVREVLDRYEQYKKFIKK